MGDVDMDPTSLSLPPDTASVSSGSSSSDSDNEEDLQEQAFQMLQELFPNSERFTNYAQCSEDSVCIFEEDIDLLQLQAPFVQYCPQYKVYDVIRPFCLFVCGHFSWS